MFRGVCRMEKLALSNDLVVLCPAIHIASILIKGLVYFL